MNGVVFQQPGWLYLSWAAVAVVALHVWAWWRRRRTLSRFAVSACWPRLLPPGLARRRAVNAVLTCLALVLVAVALSEPAWRLAPGSFRRQGRDLVFVVDCSRSMLAEDVRPNRLERAKAAVLDCLEQLQGDRVALVAFAGSAEVRCPLTVDYAFFRMTLEELGPHSVERGGTRLAEALRVAVEDVLKDSTPGTQDVILLTDGEDHDSGADRAARPLAQARARLIAVGLGDNRLGARIPVRDEQTGQRRFLTYRGQEVWTRLHDQTLRRLVAQVPGGLYFHVGTGAIDLGGIYQHLLTTAPTRRFDEQSGLKYEPEFQWFLAAALGLLFVAAWRGESGFERSRRRRPRLAGRSGRASRVAAAVLLFLLAARPAVAGVRTWVQRGNQAYAAGRYEEALRNYRRALADAPSSPVVLYNTATALYRTGRFREAAETFEAVVGLTDDPSWQAQCWHNVGNCVFRQAQRVAVADLAQALELFHLSAQYFEAALDLQPDRQDSAFNRQVALRAAATAARLLEQSRQRQRKLLEEIRRALQELIRRQQAAADRSARLASQADSRPAVGRRASSQQTSGRQTGSGPVGENADTWKAEAARAASQQRAIQADTEKLAERMKRLDHQLTSLWRSLLPQAASPLEESRQHVLLAVDLQKQAVERLSEGRPQPAHAAQSAAVLELQRALQALPARPDQQRQGEGQEDQPSSESTDRQGQQQQKQQGKRRAERVEPLPQRELSEDEQFTAPKETPDDILAQERQNKRLRHRARPSHVKPVEKDW